MCIVFAFAQKFGLFSPENIKEFYSDLCFQISMKRNVIMSYSMNDFVAMFHLSSSLKHYMNMHNLPFFAELLQYNFTST